MASLVEFTPTPPQFWPEAAAQEESDRNQSDAFMKRYEVLLRLSRCLTPARPEDLVNSIAAELRMVVDFDLLDIVVNQTNASEINPTDQAGGECEGQHFCATSGSGVSCLPFGEEIKTQCSLPLVSRGAKLGFFVVGRYDENDFAEDDIEFLTQVAGQVAIFLDNSMAYRHIAQLTQKLTPENIDFEDEILTETNFEEIVGRSAALR